MSQDAIRDTALAQSKTVIDEWDEEFDKGKVGASHMLGWGRWEEAGSSAL